MDKYEPGMAMVPMGNQPTRQPNYSLQPNGWQSGNFNADWLDKIEKMLLHSAMLTGAVADDVVIAGQAAAMAPFLAAQMTLADLDEVYTLVATRLISNPEQRAVLATAHDFMGAWFEIKAQRAAAAAATHQRRLAEYREQAEAELRANPRPMHSIADLARRDGVVLPWTVGQNDTGASDSHGEGRELAHRGESTAGHIEAVSEAVDAERLARIEKNRQAWFSLAADEERRKQRLIDKTEGSDNDGEADS